MTMFKSKKNALLAIIIAPWFAIPAMTFIDMLFILNQDGSYTTTDMGGFGLFFMNLVLYTIVYAPVSYLLTVLVFLPVCNLLHIKRQINFIRAILIGMAIGFITPSLIKSAIYLPQYSSEKKFSLFMILPDFSKIESAQPYIMSTISGVIVVMGLWVIGGMASHPGGRFSRNLI